MLECYRTPLARPCREILRYCVRRGCLCARAPARGGQYYRFQTGESSRNWTSNEQGGNAMSEGETVAAIAAPGTFYYLVADMARGFEVSRTDPQPT